MSGRGVCALCGWDDDSHRESGAVNKLCETMARFSGLRDAYKLLATSYESKCAALQAARAEAEKLREALHKIADAGCTSYKHDIWCAACTASRALPDEEWLHDRR